MDYLLLDILKPKKILTPIDTNISKKIIKLNNIKAIIFDIYGTILISGSGDIGSSISDNSKENFKKAFSNLGVSNISQTQINFIKNRFFSIIKDEHEKLIKSGYPFPEVDIISIWQKVLKKAFRETDFKECKNINPEYIAASYESISNPVYPMPKLEDVLKILNQKKIKLGIISNAQFYTPLIFKNLFKDGLDGLGFDKSLSLFSYIEKRAKPDPELFEKMKKKLLLNNIKPNESLYVGNDMLKDILPAKQADFKTALFAGDKRSLKLRKDITACKNLDSDVILKSIDELLTCI